MFLILSILISKIIIVKSEDGVFMVPPMEVGFKPILNDQIATEDSIQVKTVAVPSLSAFRVPSAKDKVTFFEEMNEDMKKEHKDVPLLLSESRLVFDKLRHPRNENHNIFNKRNRVILKGLYKITQFLRILILQYIYQCKVKETLSVFQFVSF